MLRKPTLRVLRFLPETRYLCLHWISFIIQTHITLPCLKHNNTLDHILLCCSPHFICFMITLSLLCASNLAFRPTSPTKQICQRQPVTFMSQIQWTVVGLLFIYLFFYTVETPTVLTVFLTPFSPASPLTYLDIPSHCFYYGNFQIYTKV